MHSYRRWLPSGLFCSGLGLLGLFCFWQLSPVAPPLVQARWALQPAGGTPQLAALVKAADLIVRGQVVSTQSRWNAGHTLIETENQIAVRYPLLGQPPTPLIVRTLGGELLAEDLAVTVSRGVQFAANEEVLLFLHSSAEGYQVVGHEAGKFAIANGVAQPTMQAPAYAYADLLTALTQMLPAQGKVGTLPADWRDEEVAAQKKQGVMSPISFVYGGRKWPGTSPVVKYKVNLNTSQAGGTNGSVADFRAAIQAAAESWNNVPQAEFTLEYDGESSVTDVTTSNKQNDIIFMHQGADDWVGLGFTWYRPSDKQTIVEADIWLNDDLLFDATGAPAAEEYDLQSAVLHELGHWLLLGHDEEPTSVMFALLDKGTLRRALQANDIAGIQCLYNGTGTVCSPPTATPTSAPPIPTATVPQTTPIPSPNSPTPIPTATVSPPLPTPTTGPRKPESQAVYLPVVQR